MSIFSGRLLDRLERGVMIAGNFDLVIAGVIGLLDRLQRGVMVSGRGADYSAPPPVG
jgi:hypothetical protein